MTGPIRDTTGERLQDVFVESPSRPNKTAYEVVVHNPNIPNVEIANAGSTLSALKCVYSVNPNTVDYANNNISFLNATVFGITITAAQVNESTGIQTYGILRDSSFLWASGTQLYLSTNGNLTDIAPVSGFRTLIATSQGIGQIFINIQEPIIL
jgi:hypothetical protein